MKVADNDRFHDDDEFYKILISLFTTVLLSNTSVKVIFPMYLLLKKEEIEDTEKITDDVDYNTWNLLS